MLTLKEQIRALGINENDLIFHEVATKRRCGWERQFIYKVKESADAVIIRCFLNHESEVMLAKDYYNTRYDYGLYCVETAERLQLPIGVVLAVGYFNADQLPKELVVDNLQKVKHELLETGIERRKKQIHSLVGEDLYRKFGVEKMGQLHSKRLASYLSSIIK